MVPPDRFTVALSGDAAADRAAQHVAADVWDSDAARGPVVVLAHGAGSSLDHAVHQGVCAAIADAGHTTVAFNFVYAQLGRRSPDPLPRLLRCYRDVLAWTRSRFPTRGVVAGGRSMGGRVASLLAAEGTELDGLVLLNYPLLPANRRPDSQPRVDHWPDIAVPVLFVHGSRDHLLPREVFQAHRSTLGSAEVTVHVVDEADHGFTVPRRSGRSAADVYAEVGAAVSAWLAVAVVP